MVVASLLAVDLGLRTGLAVFGDDGRLRWYRSHNLGSMTRLKRAVPGILREIDDLVGLVVEGERRLGDVWSKAAAVPCRSVPPEVWREALLWQRQRRTGVAAKRNAKDIAREVIRWSGVPLKGLRTDAAEAVLIGLWAVLERGWLTELPAAIRR